MAIKPVSFKDSELNLLDYAEEQGGFSYYVKKLIKDDMLGLNKHQAPAVPQMTMEQLLQMINAQNTIQAPVIEEPKQPPADADVDDINMADVDSMMAGLEFND